MNRVTKRTWLMGVFIFILLGGMAFFLWEYFTQADDWVVFPGSPHLYSGGHFTSGTVTDRNGNLLLDFADGRSYSSNASTRKSTLHWLGDRRGNIRGTAVEHYAAAMAGYDPFNGVYSPDGDPELGQMTLTLSAQVQNTALQALGGRKGTVGVYNYKTGELLCAVTSPTYDPDNVPQIEGNSAYEGVYLNRFIQSTYPPGSIFKVVTTAAAIDTVPGILDMQFTCTGEHAYGADRVTCEVAHGTVTLRTALSRSCNCGFAQIVELVGKENMEKYVRQFRVTEPLSFDGVTTAEGHYDLTDAAPVEQAWSGIGQYTDLINPARYMTFMGAIAGGGVGAEPHVVQQVQVGSRVTYQAKPRLSSRIMSQDVAEILQEYMYGNVEKVYGSWNFPGFQTVCGKSGTSQLGGDKISNAMFAGFIMDEEYPLAFIAVVENAGYGSANCVPVLSQVLSACKNVMDAA